ncbi:hypothetical protein [Vibrio sp. TRT 17S01]|uniref:hypothetical protein n=1 Tax=Vibrio sp. TRT 17S01 TaxID=3418505 RepID=UPI003CF22E96
MPVIKKIKITVILITCFISLSIFIKNSRAGNDSISELQSGYYVFDSVEQILNSPDETADRLSIDAEKRWLNQTYFYLDLKSNTLKSFFFGEVKAYNLAQRSNYYEVLSGGSFYRSKITPVRSGMLQLDNVYMRTGAYYREPYRALWRKVDDRDEDLVDLIRWQKKVGKENKEYYATLTNELVGKLQEIEEAKGPRLTLAEIVNDNYKTEITQNDWSSASIALPHETDTVSDVELSLGYYHFSIDEIEKVFGEFADILLLTNYQLNGIDYESLNTRKLEIRVANRVGIVIFEVKAPESDINWKMWETNISVQKEQFLRVKDSLYAFYNFRNSEYLWVSHKYDQLNGTHILALTGADDVDELVKAYPLINSLSD